VVTEKIETTSPPRLHRNRQIRAIPTQNFCGTYRPAPPQLQKRVRIHQKHIPVGNVTIVLLTVRMTLTKPPNHKNCGIYLISNSGYCNTVYLRQPGNCQNFIFILPINRHPSLRGVFSSPHSGYEILHPRRYSPNRNRGRTTN